MIISGGQQTNFATVKFGPVDMFEIRIFSRFTPTGREKYGTRSIVHSQYLFHMPGPRGNGVLEGAVLVV
jgi:hypothetical protein